jgi:hypothetical protein
MTLSDSIDIAAPAVDLFALTQDYPRRLLWDPFLRSAELLDGAAAAGAGVRAWCVAHTGLGMETVYVSFTPPRVAAVRMTKGPWLIRSFAGSWRFEEVEDGRTRVTFSYRLVARPWWLSWLLTPGLAWAFRRDTRRRLAALKQAAEGATRAVAPPLS